MNRAQRRAADKQARTAWRSARTSMERMAAGRAGGLRFVGDPGPPDQLTPGSWEMMLGLPPGSLALAWASESDRSPSVEAARELFWRAYSKACKQGGRANG
jgi:hypothetical protein